MTMLTERRVGDGLPPVWPSDRYEVVCERADTFGSTRDRYHYAKYAVESARALEKAGLARRVSVIRMADETVIYDRVDGIELPPEEW
jgi:hypothetical protein